ncbi:MAG: hypothetical protein J0L89_01545 [Xanthomonadales bacterium]|nr:hypothetical protein [Xanthomonadales bacterium]
MMWEIDQDAITVAGAIDVTLNCDTNLFIDPLLLAEASDKEFRDCATAAYELRFGQIIELLAASKKIDDVAWRAAKKQISFHEVGYTHLGYSSGEGGSGFGEKLAGNMLATAKEVVDLGVENPNLFVALALFEEGVGADRISDMTTNIVIECLAKFTSRKCKDLGVGTKEFVLNGATHQLPPNPLKETEPVLLVPKDIVRDLPIASDWSSVGAAAKETADLRDRVNANIGEIWKAKTRKDKDEIRRNAMRSKKSFETLLEVLRNAADESYDVDNDHRGEIYPANIRRSIAKEVPLDLKLYSGKKLGQKEVDEVARAIIDKFKELIEDRGLWKELWDDRHEHARMEKAMQRLFYAVALSYCEANDLDISPESDGGAGPVDFKVSSGASAKVLIELKRSSNPKLVDGYTKQLDAYRNSEGTLLAYYVIIDVGGLTSKKMGKLSEARSAVLAEGLKPSEFVIIDGNVQKSASKR